MPGFASQVSPIGGLLYSSLLNTSYVMSYLRFLGVDGIVRYGQAMVLVRLAHVHNPPDMQHFSPVYDYRAARIFHTAGLGPCVVAADCIFRSMALLAAPL